MPSCGEALIGLLEDYGVTTVFGIPGVHTLELYRGLSHSPIRHVTSRHEQGAALMADGWARVTGEPGVCLVITGPGVTNALTAVAQAYHDSQPVLVVSAVGSTAELGRGYGNIHELPDQRALTAQVTAFSRTVTEPAELPGALAAAWETFTARRPRPVHLQVPVDVLAAESPPLRRLGRDTPSTCAGPDELEEAAALLGGARSPFIVLGGGAADAGAEAAALAELLDAPVGLTINAKGSVSDRHPLCLGATIGFRPASDWLEQADVVLLVGSQLSDLDLWPLGRPLRLGGKLIRIDVDPDQLARRHVPTVGLAGDARATLASLRAACEPLSQRNRDAAARVAGVRNGMAWPPEVERYLDVVAALDEALPDDRIVAGDSTQPAYAANHALPMYRPRSWLMPIGYGSLGCALPMAIGAKLAAPERPVACLVGDGGFLFTIQELATACDLGVPLPIVLWNNSGYGEIRDSMHQADIPPTGTDATAHDYIGIARGFGCAAKRAADLAELRWLVTEALTASGPTVIEVLAE